MNILAIMLVTTGLLLLSVSLKPAIVICRQDDHLGWKFLLFLMCLFVLGYLFFLDHLCTIKTASFVELCLSIILFGGSIFVVMVINFSLTSINKIQNIAQHERYNAQHDSLTGLPNRQCFLNTIEQKIAAAEPFSVFVLDLNDFKQINDVIGHYFGDQLLIQISNRINRVLPKNTFFARVGGDEFILLSSAVTQAEIKELTITINDTFKAPFFINDHKLNTSVSIGGSIFPDNSDQIVTLLQQADVAMYASKKTQVKYTLYDAALASDAKHRLVISTQLHTAVEHNEFELYYQPLIQPKPSGMLHVEALIRWPQPDGSFIPPDKFIPIAEQNGLIRAISRWVLTTIADHLRAFKKSGIDACIHINVSARDLQNDEFLLQLADLVTQGCILPHQLVLEVTESAIMTDIANTQTMLSRLSRQGFLISLDDFGTGFSSLSILRELPINQIKVDRSFVLDMAVGNTNHSIIRSIIFLAHNLDCSVVAEGVETQAMVDELVRLKCDYLQGYYYSKAQPLASLLSLCERQGWINSSKQMSLKT